MNRFFTLVVVLLLAHGVQAGCLDQPRLRGVNLAGAEFGHTTLPGKVFTDYTYPSEAEIIYIAEQGANIIRFPFLWERVQAAPNGELNKTELNYLRVAIDRAKANGLCVLLDVHNYAEYYDNKLTDTLAGDVVLEQAFINFWIALATEFPDADNVILGLMNEPAHISIAEWAAIAKRTVLALREAKVDHMIFVAGGGWSGLHDWFAGAEASNASHFQDLTDPLKRTVIEVHQYTNENYSGMHESITSTDCRPADEFNSKFERIRQWALEHEQQLFLGEFGVPQSNNCLETLTRFVELMDADGWRGWTYWASGSWWGNYALALNGPSKPDVPQWPILKAHFFRNQNNQTSENQNFSSASTLQAPNATSH